MVQGKSCCTPSAPTANWKPSPTVPSEMPQGVTPMEVPTRDQIFHADKGSTEGMVRLEGGAFLMGTDSDERWEEDGEGPVREVQLRPFYIEPYSVTN